MSDTEPSSLKEEGSVAEVENLKAGKRKLKASITSQLNELETGNWNVWKDLMKKPCKSWKSYGRCISKRKT